MGTKDKTGIVPLMASKTLEEYANRFVAASSTTVSPGSMYVTTYPPTFTPSYPPMTSLPRPSLAPNSTPPSKKNLEERQLEVAERIATALETIVERFC